MKVTKSVPRRLLINPVICWLVYGYFLSAGILAFSQERVTGLVYYAVEDLDNPQQVLRGFAGSAGVAFDRLILSPDTNYRFWLLEAETFRVANIDVRTPSSGRNFELPDFNFRRASSHDTDGDGISDLPEFIVGTNGLDPDSDDDGILDSAEVREGTDPLEGTPARTGILASADTPGRAQDIDAFNDVVVVADGTSGIEVFNVFNGMDPLVIAQVETPGNARAVSIGGNLLGVADESGGFIVVDLRDPPTAQIAHRLLLGSDPISVDTDGQIAFVGLKNGEVVAIDMVSGVEIDRLKVTAGQADDLQIFGEHIFVVEQGSLYSLSFEFSELALLNSVSSPGTRNASHGRGRVFVADDVAYHVHNRGYNTLDVSDPNNLTLIHNENTPGFGWKHIVTNGNGLGFAAVSPNQAFDGPHHVSLYDVSDPNITNSVITEFPTPGVARAVTIYNGIGYVADDNAGMQVVNYLAYDAQGVPPSVTITSPSNGDSVEEGSSVRVRVNATDDVQVRNVEFYVDNELVKTDGNHSFEATLPMGTGKAGDVVVIEVRASDTGGNASFSDPVVLNLTPDSTPPRVGSVFPRDNSIIGETSGFTLIFSEAIDPDTISESSIYITGEGPDGFIGTPDDVDIGGGEFTQSEDGTVVSYSLGETLDSGRFRITVETSVTDAIGNQLRSRFTSVFLALGDVDTDRDGLPDFVELSIGLDPEDPDTDNDGIFDGDEDQDTDGVPNAVEVALGFDLENTDSDNNGITDAEEDADSDGLPDFREVLAGSSLNNPDSDGDGFSDEAEVSSGSSPVNPLDQPFQLVVAMPRTRVIALGSSGGTFAQGVTVASPKVNVIALSSTAGDLPPSVTVAKPSISVIALSSDTGDLPPSVTVARPPVDIIVLGSESGDIAAGVTLANPPVQVELNGDP